MREIKFRAWDLYHLKMIDLGDLENISVGHRNDDFANYKVMQFTGLKDKNGREIYEGDIIQIDGAVPFEVDFNEIIGRNWMGEEYNYEVIGNIYENPELLKGGTNGK